MAHKHSEDSPCECEKLKDAERETLREGLKECREARERDRAEREREALERAESSEGKLKKLQKQLIAFQLATAVGATVVGQDAVAKIGEKLGFLQGIQQKLMGGGGAPAAAPAAPAAPADGDKDKPKDGKGDGKVSMGGWKPYRSKEPLTQTAQAEKGKGDISVLYKGDKSNDGDGNAQMPTVTAAKVKIPVKALTQTAEEMPLALPTELPTDPYAAFLTPSTLPFDQYSTTLALGDNYGFGDYYGMGGGGSVSPISTPSPSTIAVFAVGGLANTRRRA